VRSTLQLYALQRSHLAQQIYYYASRSLLVTDTIRRGNFPLSPTMPRDVRPIKIGEDRQSYEISSKLEANGTFEN